MADPAWLVLSSSGRVGGLKKVSVVSVLDTMAHLDYVDPEMADEWTRELLESDAEYYDEPSLFARVLANNPNVLASRSAYHRGLVADGEIDERLCELVYLVVSVANDCSYCIASHREHLVERVGLPEADVDAVAAGDYDRFSADERTVIEFADLIATDPSVVDEAHVQALRDAGVDDAEIVRLVTVAAAAVAANTIADALGIDPADRETPFA